MLWETKLNLATALPWIVTPAKAGVHVDSRWSLPRGFPLEFTPWIPAGVYPVDSRLRGNDIGAGMTSGRV